MRHDASFVSLSKPTVILHAPNKDDDEHRSALATLLMGVEWFIDGSRFTSESDYLCHGLAVCGALRTWPLMTPSGGHVDSSTILRMSSLLMRLVELHRACGFHEGAADSGYVSRRQGSKVANTILLLTACLLRVTPSFSTDSIIAAVGSEVVEGTVRYMAEALMHYAQDAKDIDPVGTDTATPTASTSSSSISSVSEVQGTSLVCVLCILWQLLRTRRDPRGAEVATPWVSKRRHKIFHSRSVPFYLRMLFAFLRQSPLSATRSEATAEAVSWMKARLVALGTYSMVASLSVEALLELTRGDNGLDYQSMSVGADAVRAMERLSDVVVQRVLVEGPQSLQLVRHQLQNSNILAATAGPESIAEQSVCNVVCFLVPALEVAAVQDTMQGFMAAHGTSHRPSGLRLGGGRDRHNGTAMTVESLGAHRRAVAEVLQQLTTFLAARVLPPTAGSRRITMSSVSPLGTGWWWLCWVLSAWGGCCVRSSTTPIDASSAAEEWRRGVQTMLREEGVAEGVDDGEEDAVGGDGAVMSSVLPTSPQRHTHHHRHRSSCVYVDASQVAEDADGVEMDVDPLATQDFQTQRPRPSTRPSTLLPVQRHSRLATDDNFQRHVNLVGPEPLVEEGSSMSFGQMSGLLGQLQAGLKAASHADERQRRDNADTKLRLDAAEQLAVKQADELRALRISLSTVKQQLMEESTTHATQVSQLIEQVRQLTTTNQAQQQRMTLLERQLQRFEQMNAVIRSMTSEAASL